MKRQKRRRFFLRLFWASFALVAFFTLSLWAAYIPEINIKNISIRGSSAFGESRILLFVEDQIRDNYWSVIPKSNILFYPQHGIEEGLLNSFPNLFTASVSFVDLQSIEISVEEREPRYLWCGEDDAVDQKGEPACYFIDSEGVIFGEAPHFSGSVYFEFYGPPQGGTFRSGNDREFPLGLYLLPTGIFKNVIAIKDNLNSFGIMTKQVVIRENVDGEFVLENDSRIFFNLSQTNDAFLKNLNAAFDSSALKKEDFIHEDSLLEYLDLRFGNNLFFKFK